MRPKRTGDTAAVSVVLPHYDCARYVGDAVGSVLAQDRPDLRLYVVDDRSPDESWTTALRPYADDPRLTVLRTSRNVGHLRIKNQLLERITTPYVAFQDADDISLPDRLRRQLAVLERNRADLVGCAYEYIDAEGRATGRRRMPRHGNLWLRLGRTTVVLHPSTVVRRQALVRLGGFDGTVRFGADTDFHLRLARLYRLRSVRRTLYRYRIWPDSLTQAPDTGFGSPRRRAYTEAMHAQERRRRAARTREELLPLLIAPANDVDFELEPVRLT
ncbi:glycosyltransferase family 2 protein [Streptomyces clavuligerus]|uniref:Moenomycin biosynthesis protein MoeGT2 n=1 Tax=Streptomyces clavuligerus TaxID=1901 RepID=B5H1G5_STRCL|nr:glycosyltransferase family 2 protein [Streptomyces clavuligerus]EDY52411.1 MoeGT2 [Streptomyces clavuligerus]EFG04776.1 Moenomycin biosynthesis protein MoeGT2 [Streptomyces clavuligerus]MBY6306776.1 glycosyltransferase family 2 protein [Streptomyces clavuligerus]QCS10621.1 glycosyltransferase family 2 protein [Streptomyces clavuligerus]QPJ97341.1 glycosyltransferase [Streptomyces clavuligerus]